MGKNSTRAVALVGPAGTGKTSLAEALLFAAGAITRLGSVSAGTSLGDASPEARARRASTEMNLSRLTYTDDAFTLLDMPGGAGFNTDGIAALEGVDLALVIIDPAPERALLAGPVLRNLDRIGLPHVVVINKIETARAHAVHETVAALQPLSRGKLVLRQIPFREKDGNGEHVTGYVDLALERAYRYRSGGSSEKIVMPDDVKPREIEERAHLLETLADFDDTLLEALLGDETPDLKHIMTDLADNTAHSRLVPVVLTSAINGGGIQRLLKLLRHETPSPVEAASRIGKGLQVFKISNSLAGGAMGKLALARVLGSGLSEGDDLVFDGQTIRTGSLFFVQGDKTSKQKNVNDGDIVAVAKLDHARQGMLLATRGNGNGSHFALDLPQRNAAIAITAHDHKDEVKLSTALHRLCEEDPALSWGQDEATHQTLLRGLNNEHLGIALERLRRRYNLTVVSAPPRIAYRETIRKTASQRGRHKKQSGGHGQYGDVILEIRPLERGEGFRFEEKITGGAVPKQWFPAIEMGVRDAMEHGPLGFPVVDVAVTLTDGSYHSVDSSELAFRMAGRIAMSEALATASPYLLEPVFRLTINTPAGTGARAGSVLSARRGHILGLAPHPDNPHLERVDALLPEAETHDLDADLRSLSQGLAEFSAHFDHLAELSGKPAEDMLKLQREMAPV